MVIHLSLQNKVAKSAMLGAAIVSLIFIAQSILNEFVIGTFSDKRITVEEDLLRGAVEVFPDSGKLRARLAQVESGGDKPNYEQAEINAQAAVDKSPNNYLNFLLLASIKERRGDQPGAEQTLQEALLLAPHYSDVHWRLANMQLRQGNLAESINHFQTAVRLNPALIETTLDLLWKVTDKTDVPLLKQVVDQNQRGQISLGRFLVNENRFEEATEILRGVDRQIGASSWEIPQLIYTLINKNHPILARSLWLKFRAPEDFLENNNLIWNGDFETESVKSFEHFDWHLTHNDYARLSIDDKESYSGNNSLLLDFVGRDTTVLDLEVKQQIAVRSGITHHLEFFVKTESLRSPEGPRVVVSDMSGKTIAASPPIALGTGDWRLISFNFVSPRTTNGDGATLMISIKRQPKFSYDQPTRGRIWFDAFTLSEVRSK